MSGLQWVVNAYRAAFAAFILSTLFGSLAASSPVSGLRVSLIISIALVAAAAALGAGIEEESTA